ncbi:hypothetical protein BDV95DRAFT_603715 [Massariosphaeria phaeospora]|uniref:F-box domain-containing protein n=1 Tax=Massariosphaeria phaeospora TaxID=100035 RepID=A0A7C8IAS9_9PLEO|nr:hypothetical protein BDV95DRAFT_603715 [Massariosphaeria phaeospora]
MHTTISLTDGTSKMIGSLPTELLTEVVEYLTDKKDIQSARLVCHGFNDCSWKPFGACISETTFDLYTKRSMGNLRSITNNIHLIPHVKKLTFGAMLSPFVELYDPTSEKSCSYSGVVEVDPFEFTRISTLTTDTSRRIWYPSLWNVDNTDSNVAPTSHSTSWQKQFAVEALASYLSKLDKLTSVTYTRRSEWVGYGAMFVQNSARPFEVLRVAPIRRSASADIGLDVLLRAMDQGGVQPTELSIPVTTFDSHSFVTFIPDSMLRKVLSKVENLTLMGHFGHYYALLMDYPDFEFVHSNLPRLKELTLNAWNSFNMAKTLETFPSPVQLKHFVPGDCPIDMRSNGLYDFIAHVSSKLIRSLRVEVSCYGDDSLRPLLRFLRTSRIYLDFIEIEALPEHEDQPKRDYAEWHYKHGTTVPLDLLSGAAKEFRLIPPE